MQTKAFEIRDKSTFIPMIGILMSCEEESPAAEYHLMRRAGYSPFEPPYCVILCRLEASSCNGNATYDPFSWTGGRTLPTVHAYITAHWESLESGAVIDVEFILNESAEPKKAERFTSNY